MLSKLAPQVARPDAELRLGRCKQLEQELTFQRQLESELQRALSAGTTNLSRAQQLIRSKELELQNLETQLENAELLEQMTALASTVRQGVLQPSGESAARMQELQRRVVTAQRRARHADFATNAGSIVDWQAAEGRGVSQQIAEYLSEGEAQDSLDPILEVQPVVTRSGE